MNAVCQCSGNQFYDRSSRSSLMSANPRAQYSATCFEQRGPFSLALSKKQPSAWRAWAMFICIIDCMLCPASSTFPHKVCNAQFVD